MDIFNLPCSHQPRMIWAWSGTASFPMCFLLFQIRTSKRKPNVFPEPVCPQTHTVTNLVSPPPTFLCQQPPIGAPSSAPSETLPNACVGG